MADKPSFAPGDVVLHASRPEWGRGVVDQVSATTHQGLPAQQLIIRFENHGRITLNSAVAPLLCKDASTSMTTLKTASFPSTSSTSGHPTVNVTADRGWLGALGQKARPSEEIARLPQPMTDPFASPARRLAATLESFRYNGAREPRNARLLLEWAQAQSGLSDPLSKYTRHEIEEAFPRFVRDRDNHLAALVKQLKHAARFDQIEEAISSLPAPLRDLGRQNVMKFLR